MFFHKLSFLIELPWLKGSFFSTRMNSPWK